jgi:outer membrane protein assembly factor BamB
MARHCCLIVAVVGLLGAPGGISLAAVDEIITQPAAAIHGLTRGWMVQMDMDRSRSRLANLVLFEGVIYAQTNRNLIRAYDAETGKPTWETPRQIGNPDFPSSAIAVGGDLLAVTNGSRLYVLNRHSGDLLWDDEIAGAPSAQIAVGDMCVYVPVYNGAVLAYRLQPEGDFAKKKSGPKLKSKNAVEAQEPLAPPLIKDLRLSQKKDLPLTCPADGKAMVEPLVIRAPDSLEQVVWPTDQGYLFIGINDPETNRLLVKSRMECGAEIVAPASYLPPDPKVRKDFGMVFTVSRDGYVYAANATSGDSIWRFPAGEPIVQPAAVIETNLYVTSQLGGMYCLDAKTGAQRWWAPDAAQFVAASKDRLYVADKLNHLLVIDAQHGSRLDSISLAALPIRLFNTQTDRIYLASEGGLIQSLHEEGLPQPLLHGEDRKRAPEKPVVEKEEVEKPKPKPKPKPAGDRPTPKPAAKKPPAEKPAPTPKVPKTPKTPRGRKAKAGAGDNPFGAGAGGAAK